MFRYTCCILMDAWAQFCAAPAADAKVLHLRKPKRAAYSAITHMYVGEVAQLLGKSRAELDTLIAAGQLPEPDQSGRLPAAAVDRLLAEQ
jgi:hypothetical protein